MCELHDPGPGSRDPGSHLGPEQQSALLALTCVKGECRAHRKTGVDYLHIVLCCLVPECLCEGD